MKAVILAGGKGTRLSPYTKILPKPLMPIGDMPILEVLLRQIKTAGINEVILAVGIYLNSYVPFLMTGKNLVYKLDTVMKKNHSAQQVAGIH